MFEALLVGLLNKHLSPYVDGLSSKDLSLGVWKGDVTLKNLSIKPEVGAVGGVCLLLTGGVRVCVGAAAARGASSRGPVLDE